MLNIKNRTGYQYLASHVRAEHAHHGGNGQRRAWPDGTIGRWRRARFEDSCARQLVFLRASPARFWYFQFFFYQMGESQMGNYKSSPVGRCTMASIIIFSTLWGIFFKEWRGAKALTKSLVVIMLLFLIGSTCIIGWGNKFPKMRPTRRPRAKPLNRLQNNQVFRLKFNFDGGLGKVAAIRLGAE